MIDEQDREEERRPGLPRAGLDRARKPLTPPPSAAGGAPRTRRHQARDRRRRAARPARRAGTRGSRSRPGRRTAACGLYRDRQCRLEEVDVTPRTNPPRAAPARLPRPPITPPTKAIKQRPLADVGRDRAGAEDVQDGDGAREQAGDGERRRRSPSSPARRRAAPSGNPRVDARSWMPSVVRFSSRVMPRSSPTVTIHVSDLELRDQDAADVELVREPRVGLDALLRPRPDRRRAVEPRRRSRPAPGGRS